MLIKLLPDQIPQFWEAIKYAAVKAEGVEEENIPYYVNNLLYMLLSNKATCLVKLNNERKFIGLTIVQVVNDEARNGLTMFQRVVYAYESSSLDDWKDTIKEFKKFAISLGCKYWSGWASNEQMAKICELAGGKRQATQYVIKLD
jgi:hypothetical protein